MALGLETHKENKGSLPFPSLPFASTGWIGKRGGSRLERDTYRGRRLVGLYGHCVGKLGIGFGFRRTASIPRLRREPQ